MDNVPVIKNGFARGKGITFLAHINHRSEMAGYSGLKGVFFRTEKQVSDRMKDISPGDIASLSEVKFQTIENAYYNEYRDLAKNVGDGPVIIRTFYFALSKDKVYGGYYGDNFADYVTLRMQMKAALRVSADNPRQIALAFPFHSPDTDFTHYQRAFEVAKHQLLAKSFADNKLPSYGDETVDNMLTELKDRHLQPPFNPEIRIGVTVPDTSFSISKVADNVEFVILNSVDADSLKHRSPVLKEAEKNKKELVAIIGEEASAGIQARDLLKNGINTAIVPPFLVDTLSRSFENI